MHTRSPPPYVKALAVVYEAQHGHTPPGTRGHMFESIVDRLPRRLRTTMETMLSRHSPSPFSGHTFKTPSFNLLTEASASTSNPMWSLCRGELLGDESSNDMIRPPSNTSDAFNAALDGNGPTLPDYQGQSASTTTTKRSLPPPKLARRAVPSKLAKTFFCPSCNDGFTRRSSMNKHYKSKHTLLGQMKYCPFAHCSFVTRNPHALASHKRSQHAPTSTTNGGRSMLYFCRACRQRFGDRRTLLAHLSRRHASDASLFGRQETSDERECTTSLADSLAHNAELLNRLNGATSVVDEEEELVDDQPIAVVVDDDDEEVIEQMDSVVSSLPTDDPIEEPAEQRPSTPMSSIVTRQQEKSSSSPKQSMTTVKNPSFPCEECSYSGKSFRSLFAHRRRAHKPPKETIVHRRACQHCHRPFTTARRLAAHVKSCRKRYPCAKCDFTTSTKRLMIAHDKKKHIVNVVKVSKASPRRPVDDTKEKPTVLRIEPTTPHIQPIKREAHLDEIQPSVAPSMNDSLHDCIGHLTAANTSLHQLLAHSNSQLTLLRSNIVRLFAAKGTPRSLNDEQRTLIGQLGGESVDRFVASLLA